MYFVSHAGHQEDVTLICHSLHWLPIELKVAVLILKALDGTRTGCLRECVCVFATMAALFQWFIGIGRGL